MNYTIITYTARSLSPIHPEKTAKNSKAHHSKHIINIPGTPIYKYKVIYFLLNIDES